MSNDTWTDWQVTQLNECLIRDIAPSEAAALIGKSTDEVCAEMRELGLLPVSQDSPSTVPDALNPFPRDVAAS